MTLMLRFLTTRPPKGKCNNLPTKKPQAFTAWGFLLPSIQHANAISPLRNLIKTLYKHLTHARPLLKARLSNPYTFKGKAGTVFVKKQKELGRGQTQ